MGSQSKGQTIVYALLLVLAAIDAAISTSLLARYPQYRYAYNNSMKEGTILIVFTSWFTLVFSSPFMLLFRLHPKKGGFGSAIVAHALYLGILWILWTAGVIIITSNAGLGGAVNCGYVGYKTVFCYQQNSMLAFSWAAWTVTTIGFISIIIIGIRFIMRGRGHQSNPRGHPVPIEKERSTPGTAPGNPPGLATSSA